MGNAITENVWENAMGNAITDNVWESDSKAKTETCMGNAITEHVWETLLQSMYGKRYYRACMGNATTEHVWETLLQRMYGNRATPVNQFRKVANPEKAVSKMRLSNPHE